MASNTDLRVRISADLADIKQGLGLLRGELAKVKAQSAQAFGASNSNALVGSLRRVRTEMLGLVGAYASLAGAKLLAGIADEATRVRGRIREAKGDYEAILALANETRASLAGTTDLYARLERSTRGRVKGQADLLAITKSVNQAIKLSYTGTAQGEAAVLQLGQALASGKLAGDEFRSISENAPRLMQAISDAVGRPIGELKNLAKEGKLTTDVIVQSLLSQGKVLEEEYARVPVTIGDAFTEIRNSFVDYVGKADDASGASQRFAAALQDVARNLPQLLDPLLRAITLLIQNLDVLAVYIGTRIALAALPAMASAITTVIGLITAARAATLTWSVALATLGGPVGIALAAIAAGLSLVYQRTNDAKAAAEEHTQALADNAALSRTSAAAALAEAQAKRIQAAATLQAARAALEERRAKAATANTRANLIVGEGRFNQTGRAAANAGMEARRAQQDVAAAEKVYTDWGARLASLAVEMQMPLTAPAVKTGAAMVSLGDSSEKAGKKAKAGAEKVKEAVRGIADANTLAQDQVKRDLDALEQQFEDGALKAAAYFAQRTALQLQAIDLQIQQAQAEAATATSTEQQSRALTEIIKLQRDRAAIGPATAREQAKAEKEAAAATLDALRAKQADILQQLRGGTDYLASQEQLGAVGPADAERQLFELRQRSVEQLRTLRQAMIDYLATTAPGSAQHTAAVAGLQQLDTELAGVEASQKTFFNTAREQGVSALTGLFNKIGEGVRSWRDLGDAVKATVVTFVQGLARMAAEALAKRIIFSLFKALPSANGNAFGNNGMLSGFANGAAFALPGLMAFANGGAFTNSIVSSPTLFTFGGGGQFGVMGEAGPEAVMPLSRGTDGKLGVKSQGGGGGRPQRIVIVDDVRQAEQFMRSSSMEEAVLYHLGNNPGRAKEILGG